MDTQHSALNTRKQQATPRGVGVMCQWYAEKAENATIWDKEGKQYIQTEPWIGYRFLPEGVE